jgi:hypothetical protein
MTFSQGKMGNQFRGQGRIPDFWNGGAISENGHTQPGSERRSSEGVWKQFSRNFSICYGFKLQHKENKNMSCAYIPLPLNLLNAIAP